MMVIASLLITASAAIVFVLGGLHLLFTFRGTKLHPREPATIKAMEQSGLVLTRQTTVWRAWIGFNASHSLGILLFALVYGWLAWAAPALLFSSVFLRVLGLVWLASYVVLAHRYWFSTPFRGVVLATLLYIAGVLVAL